MQGLTLAGLRARAEFLQSAIERERPGQGSQRGLGLYVHLAYHWFPKVFLIEPKASGATHRLMIGA